MKWFPAHFDVARTLVTFTLLIAALEYMQIRRDRHFVLNWNPWARAALLSFMLAYILVVAQHTETQFIYFQF